MVRITLEPPVFINFGILFAGPCVCFYENKAKFTLQGEASVVLGNV